MKKIMLLILSLFVVVSVSAAQEFAVDKGAAILDANVSFASYSGDLFENADGDAETVMSLNGTYNYFLAKNIFVGGALGWTSDSQGDVKLSSMSIGPQVGYAVGKAESKMFPFAALGFRYMSSSYDDGTFDAKETGSDIAIELGLVIPVKEHIGFTPLLSYHMQSMKSDEEGAEAFDGNVLLLGFGLSGLLY